MFSEKTVIECIGKTKFDLFSFRDLPLFQDNTCLLYAFGKLNQLDIKLLMDKGAFKMFGNNISFSHIKDCIYEYIRCVYPSYQHKLF